ncbi:SigE family RNA polymerase sigma factor [Micromonospora sp. NBC_01412]|uniref:SigE family RNA polymerase sigma factor n=1 Tax=Micromonospora sp. NBC_01412 TaxID=2903590 RepID=UPI003866B1AA
MSLAHLGIAGRSPHPVADDQRGADGVRVAEGETRKSEHFRGQFPSAVNLFRQLRVIFSSKMPTWGWRVYVTDDGFREFVEIRYADLLRTAYLLTGSRHAAEDLVQNALMQAMRRWRQVDEPMAYIRRIMVNERVSLWHRFGSREFLAGVTGAWRLHADRGRSRDVAEDVVVREEVREALRGLPTRTRAVLVLRYWDDLTEAQTAQTLGCSVGTVKSLASRGIGRLRAALLTSSAGSSRPGEPVPLPDERAPLPDEPVPLPGDRSPMVVLPAVTSWRGANDGG